MTGFAEVVVSLRYFPNNSFNFLTFTQVGILFLAFRSSFIISVTVSPSVFLTWVMFVAIQVWWKKHLIFCKDNGIMNT